MARRFRVIVFALALAVLIAGGGFKFRDAAGLSRFKPMEYPTCSGEPARRSVKQAAASKPELTAAAKIKP